VHQLGWRSWINATITPRARTSYLACTRRFASIISNERAFAREWTPSGPERSRNLVKRRVPKAQWTYGRDLTTPGWDRFLEEMPVALRAIGTWDGSRRR
jgi:hypothetical protein